MPRPSNSSFMTTQITRGKAYKSQSSSLRSLLHSPVTLSLPVPNIFLNTPVPNTLSLRSSRNVRDQVVHPKETIGKIILLYVSIFIFLDSRIEDKRFCTGWQQAFPDSPSNTLEQLTVQPPSDTIFAGTSTLPLHADLKTSLLC